MRCLAPLLALLLSGCVSYTYDISDREPYAQVGVGFAKTAIPLNLYQVTGNGGATFRKYVLSPDTMKNARNPRALIGSLPVGSEVRLQRIFREKGADGYLWDFVFGSVLIDGAEFEFETNLGLSDSPRPIPFVK